MQRLTDIESLLTEKVIIDVRSPIEYNHAHIPTAKNLPLFSDEERKIVGTTYKHLGKRPAIEKGLEFVSFPRILKDISRLEIPHSVAIYCARGGMRSASMAWLMELLGYEVHLVDGGYKKYRKWVSDQFLRPYRLQVLGGETGSGKTKILKAIEKAGNHIVDLEGLAQHRGSVFGYMDKQPTQEQFENTLAQLLNALKNNTIWIEDESERIGSLVIPHHFFEQMRLAPMIVLDAPYDTRVQECLNEYVPLGKKQLSIAIHRLQKRLGGLETKKAVEAIEQDQYEACCKILLHYYDKKYRYAIGRKNPDKVSIFRRENRTIEETGLALLRILNF